MQNVLTRSILQLNLEKYAKPVLVGAVVVAAIVGGIFYYRRTEILREQSSGSALTESLEQLSQAYAATNDWQEVDVAATAGLQQYGGTKLGPYFQAIQAQALAQQGDIDAALERIEAMLNRLPCNALLHNLFQITRARMKLDAPDAQRQKEGLDELKILAEDKQNYFRDKALFYLHEYYQAVGDFAHAAQVKQLLEALSAQAGEYASIWAQLLSSHD